MSRSSPTTEEREREREREREKKNILAALSFLKCVIYRINSTSSLLGCCVCGKWNGWFRRRKMGLVFSKDREVLGEASSSVDALPDRRAGQKRFFFPRFSALGFLPPSVSVQLGTLCSAVALLSLLQRGDKRLRTHHSDGRRRRRQERCLFLLGRQRRPAPSCSRAAAAAACS